MSDRGIRGIGDRLIRIRQFQELRPAEQRRGESAAVESRGDLPVTIGAPILSNLGPGFQLQSMLSPIGACMLEGLRDLILGTLLEKRPAEEP